MYIAVLIYLYDLNVAALFPVRKYDVLRESRLALALTLPWRSFNTSSEIMYVFGALHTKSNISVTYTLGQ
jgi:hypothetical protein